eukprot:998035-Pelagomonas_calceolata.AAC.1
MLLCCTARGYHTATRPELQITMQERAMLLLSMFLTELLLLVMLHRAGLPVAAAHREWQGPDELAPG